MRYIKMRLQQKSLFQTAIAIVIMEDGSERQIPLFSSKPFMDEVPKLQERLPIAEVKHVYLSNNLMKYKIENTIEAFVSTHGYLPENFMNELRSGFPFIYNSIEFNALPIGLSYS